MYAGRCQLNQCRKSLRPKQLNTRCVIKMSRVTFTGVDQIVAMIQVCWHWFVWSRRRPGVDYLYRIHGWDTSRWGAVSACSDLMPHITGCYDNHTEQKFTQFKCTFFPSGLWRNWQWIKNRSSGTSAQSDHDSTTTGNSQGVPVTKATTPGALSAYHHGHRVLYDPVMTLHESVSRNDGLSPTLSQMSNLLRVTFSRFSYNALASCLAGVQLPLASHICHTYIHTSPGLPTITTPSLVPILKSYIIYSIQWSSPEATPDWFHKGHTQVWPDTFYMIYLSVVFNSQSCEKSWRCVH